jgi:hypothetical protein
MAFHAFHSRSFPCPAFRALRSSDSPWRSKTKLFHIELSDLQVPEQDPVKPGSSHLQPQLFESEYLADEDSVLVPADVAAIVHPSQKETLRVLELRQLAWHADGAGLLETCRNLVVQALMRALVVEHGAKVIEAALLCTKGSRRRFIVSSFSVRCIRSWRPFCCGRPD